MTDEPDDIDLRAGEYVLGVLDAESHAAIRDDLANNRVLADAVAGWERRLAPLTGTVPRVTPAAALWERISARIDRDVPDQAVATPAASTDAVSVIELRRALRFWRRTAGVVSALAACLVAILLLRPAPVAKPGTLYAAAITDRETPTKLWIATAQPDGKIMITAFGSVSKPPDKDLQLWGIPADGALPVPLGLLPTSGSYMVTDAGLPLANLLFMVSMEHRGGSPTGLPTGPVLFGGELTASR